MRQEKRERWRDGKNVFHHGSSEVVLWYLKIGIRLALTGAGTIRVICDPNLR
jgi:hypothetical protein